MYKYHLSCKYLQNVVRQNFKLCHQYQFCTGLVIHSGHLEDRCSTALTSSFCKKDDNGKVVVSAVNVSDKEVTSNYQTEKAPSVRKFEARADNLIEIDPQLNSLAKMRNPDGFEGELSQLIQDFQLQKDLNTKLEATLKF